MQQKLSSRELVLVGAGHTNMHIVRMWRMHPIDDVQLTVVSPFSRATYSGMLPGTVAGLYTADEMEIDLYRLLPGCGAKLIVAEAVGLNVDKREIHLRNRPPIRFDVASIGIGSEPAGREIWGNAEEVLSIKPMATFRVRLDARLARLKDARHLPADIVVVGAGAAGTEVALCLSEMLSAAKFDARITIVNAHATILNGYEPSTIRLAMSACERSGVAVVTGKHATAFNDGHLHFNDQSSLKADVVIWATRAAPPQSLEKFDLPKAADGFLAVQRTLQSVNAAPVFAVGDSGTIIDDPVPKAGVYAVREGPVLWKNIRNHFSGRPLVEYEPQRSFLSLLATGDGRAIGQYKGKAFEGRWVWKWKDHVDRKFMRMYQDYRPMSAMKPRSQQEVPVIKCKGCGGKVGASVLAAALSRLDVPSADHVCSGLNAPDDAALLDTRAAVDAVTVDFFHAFLADPYLVGRIAALNALSDLWASGAEPVGALATVTVPGGSHSAQEEILFQVLAGGVHELNEAGAVLLGGHTTEGAELSIGYTALGRMNGLEPFLKSRLCAGDQLVLTKPLGTGALLAAHMHAKCRAEWMDEAVATMLMGNRTAAEVARAHDVQAVTDITGFGLAGHLLEMLDASGCSASIQLEKLPLLPGFTESVNDGLRSTLDPSNRATEPRVVATAERRSTPAYDALFDPQTSGGLLIAVAKNTSDALRESLRDCGLTKARRIGEVVSTDAAPEIRLS